MSYAKKTIRSSVWAMVQSWGNRAITLLVFVVLARVLRPEDFGIAALAMAYVSVVEVLVNLGMPGAVLQRRGLSQGHLDSAFWAALGFGVLWCALTYLMAPLAAELLELPELEAVLRACGFLFVITAAGAVPFAVLRRQMKFKVLAVRAVMSGAVGGCVGIAMALNGYGVWALVAMSLAIGLINTITVWVAKPWSLGLEIKAESFKELFPFGSRLLGADIVTYGNRVAYDALVGLTIGSVALGYYSVGSKLILIVFQLVNSSFAQVLESSLARIQGDWVRLQSAVSRTLMVVGMITFPVYVGMAAVSDQLVPVVFGQKWSESVGVVRWLSIGGALQCFGWLLAPLLFALGKSDLLLRLNLLRLVVSVVMFFVFMDAGSIGAAMAYAVSAALVMPIDVVALIRVSGLTFKEYFALIKAPVISVSVMWGALEVLKLYGGQLDIAVTAMLAGNVIAGVILYVSCMLIVGRSQVSAVREILMRAVK